MNVWLKWTAASLKVDQGFPDEKQPPKTAGSYFADRNWGPVQLGHNHFEYEQDRNP